MAGRISEADRERVRDANRIEQVVAEYVALRPAGGGNLKGLCPFHDEKTPSFQVRGDRYHCFGCGASGDVFEFLRSMEHLTFIEAVQRLADRAGVTLTLMEGGSSTAQDRGTRSRLVAANRAAAEFYAAQLRTDAAAAAREYLTTRGFDDAAATRFGCGYAPAGWDSLVKHLTGKGFSLEELFAAKLARQGQQGPIDTFHRRLLWAIRDSSGDVVGFGARRLYDDDRIEAKYLNTADSPLYRKSQVLFGLDLAKKDIARERQAVIVEGYTDVMAMHLAGVTTAVASCGTAFGEEHIGVLRRYLLDSDVIRGEVVYTFDGDEAGQKAALKAFESDQRFAAHTFVSVAPDGMDPCELRQHHGDAAVRDLVAARIPLFAFAIRETLKGYNLDTAEGRVAAATATVPMVARIKDGLLREEYVRELAGWLGTDPRELAHRVRRQATADRSAPRGPNQHRGPAGPPNVPGPAMVGTGPGTGRATEGAGASAAPEPAFERPNPTDRRYHTEREALKLALQHPELLGSDFDEIDAACFSEPSYAAVHDAVVAAGGPVAGVRAAGSWVGLVSDRLPSGALRTLVGELAVERLPHKGRADPSYAGAVLASLTERVVAARERSLRSDLQRAEAERDHVKIGALLSDLVQTSEYRRALARRAAGV